MRIVPFESVLRSGVVALWNEIFAVRRNFRPLTVETFRARIEECRASPTFRADHFLVALDGAQAVGFAHGGLWEPWFAARLFPAAAPAGYLAVIGVAAARRRQGIGSALLVALRSAVVRGSGSFVADGRSFNPFYGNFHTPLPPLWGTTEGLAIPEDDGATNAFFLRAGFRTAARAVSLRIELRDGARQPPPELPVALRVLDDYVPGLGTTLGLSFPIANSSRTWVVDGDGVQLGYLCAYPFSDSKRARQEPVPWGIHSVEVTKAARGRGLGAHLVGAFLAWLRERRAPWAEVLAVPEESPEAVRLYERAGFRAEAAWTIYE